MKLAHLRKDFIYICTNVSTIRTDMKKVLTTLVIALVCTSFAGAQDWLKPNPHSPFITEDSVIFRVAAPNAESVSIQGSWMTGWGGKAMQKEADGFWYYRIEKPAPEIYMYSLNIDGVSCLDPSNFRIFRDGQSVKNLMFIRGEEEPFVAYDDKASTEKGQIVKCWYNSSVNGYARRLSVYLPYGYTTSKEYPVLYLQHGGGGDEDCWATVGRVSQIMDYLIERKKAVPMIIVMPNSMPIHEASADVVIPEKWVEDMRSDEFANGTSYVKSIYTDIIPYIEKTFSVKKDKAHRAIAGLSMGGIYTLHATEQRADLFDYIGILSMGLTPDMDGAKMLAPLKKEGYKLYWIGCGKQDAYANAERLMKQLDEYNMPYTYFGEVGGHDWSSWRKDLFEFAPLLFR